LWTREELIKFGKVTVGNSFSQLPLKYKLVAATKGGDDLKQAGKVTVGLADSNGSLLLGL